MQMLPVKVLLEFEQKPRSGNGTRKSWKLTPNQGSSANKRPERQEQSEKIRVFPMQQRTETGEFLMIETWGCRDVRPPRDGLKT